MKNKILTFAICIFIIYSCKLKETSIDLCKLKETSIDLCKVVSIKYENNNRSKNLYIVDTFYIEKPVIIDTADGFRFVMSKRIYDNYKGGNRYLFENENVYLCKYELPFSIPHDLFSKNIKSTPCFPETNDLPMKKNIISSRQYIDESGQFQLILIRGDYYNKVYTELGGSSVINIPRNEFSYYRVAIPICVE